MIQLPRVGWRLLACKNGASPDCIIVVVPPSLLLPHHLRLHVLPLVFATVSFVSLSFFIWSLFIPVRLKFVSLIFNCVVEWFFPFFFLLSPDTEETQQDETTLRSQMESKYLHHTLSDQQNCRGQVCVWVVLRWPPTKNLLLSHHCIVSSSSRVFHWFPRRVAVSAHSRPPTKTDDVVLFHQYMLRIVASRHAHAVLPFISHKHHSRKSRTDL